MAMRASKSIHGCSASEAVWEASLRGIFAGRTPPGCVSRRSAPKRLSRASNMLADFLKQSVDEGLDRDPFGFGLVVELDAVA